MQPSLTSDLRTSWFEPFDLMNRELARIQDRFPRGPVETSIAADIEEDDAAFVVSLDLPGFRKDDVDISVNGGVLGIRAERKRIAPENGNGGSRRHLSERRFARVERSFVLPDSVDANAIEASLRDGVLEVKLPKKELGESRRIDLK